MNSLRESLKKINCNARIRYNESMSKHSTFRTGGSADIFVQPKDVDALKQILRWAKDKQISYTIIGGGANILVSDKGIRGLVIDTSRLTSLSINKNDSTLTCFAGLAISTVSKKAADAGLAGLEFIYSMPGSTGGAVYMNARCYGSELGDILLWINYLDDDLNEQTMIPSQHHFDYKDTPFMKQKWIITQACFKLKPGKRNLSWQEMRKYESDRRAKGHFIAPCAGSVFKNNRSFGAPSGQIIDSLGLRGTRIGGAKISDLHANIIINHRRASSNDIRELMILVKNKVKKNLGFDLEEEVILLGDWN